MPAIRTGNSAVDIQVLDGRVNGCRRAFNIPERCGVGFRRAIGKGQRVALSVEDAGEVVVSTARHAADADARTQFHGLAGEDALVVVGQHVAEHAPARSGVDGVLVAAHGEVITAVWAQGDGAAGQTDVVAAVGGGAVVERLPALDVHGAEVAAVGGDEVGALIQAEGDGAIGADARGVITWGGRHLPAVDGDGLVVGIDSAVAVPCAGGADDAAVDGEAAPRIDGVVFTGDGEAPRARALAVDGKGKVATEADRSLVVTNIDGHLRAVGEDDVDGAERACIADLIRVADVAFHDIPTASKSCLAAREHGGGDVVACAVLVDVVGLYVRCPRRCAGHDERERHGRPHEVVF